MAKWSGSTSSDLVATVVYGDTLSEIAVEASKRLGKKITYQQLAQWNNILDADEIYVGNKIKCYKPGSSGGSSSSSSTKTPDPNVSMGVLSTNENQLIAHWTWSKSSATETDSYKVQWTYRVAGTDLWLEGTTTSIKVDEDDPSMARRHSFNIPSGAIRVRFRVKPIAKKRKDSKGNETDKPRWTANWSEYEYWENGETPKAPSQPSIEVDGSEITATVDYGNTDTDGVTHVVFAFVKDNDEKSVYTTGKQTLKAGVASYKYTGSDDSEYKVRVRAYVKRTANNKSYDVYSEWSPYSESARTKPKAPKSIEVLRADTSTQVYIKWTKVTTADNYEIEYTEDTRYFDKSSQTRFVTTEDNTAEYYVNGLESGKEYFFRVRAIRENAESGWTGVKSVAVGTKPAAPTTWSSSSTIIENDNATLYWVHNARDSSRQTTAKLQLDGIGDEPIIITLGSEAVDNEYISYVPKQAPLEEDEPTYECVLKTGIYEEGASIQWSVQTAGVKLDESGKPEYGPWSTPRTIDIYTRPVAIISVLDTVTSFPIDIEAQAGPNTDVQSPTGYQITITAVEGYETTDSLGNFKMVKAGEDVYSKYYNPDAEGKCILELMPSSITLENGMSYIATCIASMTSGLTAEVSKEFTVSWEISVCEPNAEIGVNRDTLTASVRPYCETRVTEYRPVEVVNIGTKYDRNLLNVTQFKETDGTYVEYRLADAEPLEQLYTEILKRKVGTREYQVKLADGGLVYTGVDDDGNDVIFTTVDVINPVTAVWMSVYRREFDGSFTEIATNLDGEKNTTVTDPHPALDYARYRIVAADKETGHVEYFDCPAHPVDGIAAVLQWDEEWTNFDAVEDHIPERPAVAGSMLKLPYNIDVSDNSKPENTLVEYIGRSHPVSYYGTQIGSTSSWNMVIPKDDVDTLYALRRLSRWLGDVYVREPSGSGYWAQVTVSFSQKHGDLIIPVSLTITRVEGGA